MESEFGSAKQVDKLQLDFAELKSKVDIISVKIDSMAIFLNDLKQGMASRVEKHGEEIAVLKENVRSHINGKDFAVLHEKVDSLETSSKLVIGSVVGSYFMNLWMLFKK